MINNNHPITPPPELVEQWLSKRSVTSTALATQAARWGADQELEACCGWLNFYAADVDARDLRNARRPKPQSLKEKALEALNDIEDNMLGPTTQEKLIRRALESLPD